EIIEEFDLKDISLDVTNGWAKHSAIDDKIREKAEGVVKTFKEEGRGLVILEVYNRMGTIQEPNRMSKFYSIVSDVIAESLAETPERKEPPEPTIFEKKPLKSEQTSTKNEQPIKRGKTGGIKRDSLADEFILQLLKERKTQREILDALKDKGLKGSTEAIRRIREEEGIPLNKSRGAKIDSEKRNRIIGLLKDKKPHRDILYIMKAEGRGTSTVTIQKIAEEEGIESNKRGGQKKGAKKKAIATNHEQKKPSEPSVIEKDTPPAVRNKFFNTSDKKDVILSVFKTGDMMRGSVITKRIKKLGYRVDEQEIKMFIYYHMIHQYLEKEKIKGVNYYYRISDGSRKPEKSSGGILNSDGSRKPKKSLSGMMDARVPVGYVQKDSKGNVPCPDRGGVMVPADGSCFNIEGIEHCTCTSYLFIKGKDIRCRRAD
ncbi:hypothetical protein LCGC14_2083960, partial [marine sediment metagenome]